VDWTTQAEGQQNDSRGRFSAKFRSTLMKRAISLIVARLRRFVYVQRTDGSHEVTMAALTEEVEGKMAALSTEDAAAAGAKPIFCCQLAAQMCPRVLTALFATCPPWDVHQRPRQPRRGKRRSAKKPTKRRSGVFASLC